MTKRILSIIFALVIAAIPALAGIVNVDFLSLSGGPFDGADLTAGSVPLSGITFAYDTQGPVPPFLPDVAYISSTGIYGFNTDAGGLLSGALNLAFDYPVVGLSFIYSVYDVRGAVVDDVFATFTPLGLLEDLTGTFGYGSLASLPTGVTPFSLATLYFGDGIAGHSFTIDSIQYDSTVPEPGTVALLACGLLGLCGRKLLRSRS